MHELRHAYAALALDNGDSVKVVQQNLGYASADFTLKVYAYTSNGMHQNSAENGLCYKLEGEYHLTYDKALTAVLARQEAMYQLSNQT